MLMFRRPKELQSLAVYPDEAHIFIESLRRFITHDELKRRTVEYHSPGRRVDGVRVARMREKQPLIEAFEAYDKQTLRGNRPLRQIDGEIGDLANIGMDCHVLAPTLSGTIERVHRDKLISLDGQLKPLLLEWKMAAHYARANGADIAWLDVHESGPEFVARANGMEWKVECKRVSHMVTELLGDAEADVLAAQIIQRLQSEGLCGVLTVRISQDFAALSAAGRVAGIDALVARLQVGQVSAAVAGELQLDGQLKHTSGEAIEARLWQLQMQKSMPPDARGYARALASAGCAVGPITVFLAGPQRSSGEVVSHLWERKFMKAARQCTGDRGAVLVFEWAGVEEASVFAQSDGMQALMARTFDEFRNVATIIMRCDSTPVHANGSINYGTRAYLASSNVTEFPDLAAMAHLNGQPG